MKQERYAGRYQCAEQHSKDQHEPPKIADALLERRSSRQAMETSANDENYADRQCTRDTSFQNLDCSQMVPGPSSPRTMNRDPNEDAAVYSGYRDREREKIDVTTRSKSWNWNCHSVDQKRRVADQCDRGHNAQESNHNPRVPRPKVAEGVIRQVRRLAFAYI
jgi:hypothetical protein